MHVGTKASRDQVKQRMGGEELEMLNKMFSIIFCKRNERNGKTAGFLCFALIPCLLF